MPETQTFNSPIATGVRALILLAESYPDQLDLQRLLEFDYILVHTKDVDGPPSIHPALPLRSGELLVRRQLIDRAWPHAHAASQGGYFTSKQSAAIGYTAPKQNYHVQVGNWVRERRGIFRLST